MLSHLKANVSKHNAIAIFCIGRKYPSYHLQEHAIDFVASSRGMELVEKLLANSDNDSVTEQLLIVRGLSTTASLKEVQISHIEHAMAALKSSKTMKHQIFTKRFVQTSST